MHSVTCDSWLPYSTEKIYAVLTDADKLTQVVKRLAAIEVLDREGESGDVVAIVDLPGGKTFRTLGHVEGIAGQSLTFKTDMPVALHIMWELTPHSREDQNGTQVTYTVAIDLKPVAAFVSKVMLRGYLSSEMQRDLATLEEILSTAASPA